MIAALISKSQRNQIIISTGNILGANQKPACKSKEELVEGLKQLLEDDKAEINDSDEIHRTTDDLHKKINENDRSNISIGAKIFLNNKSTDCLNNAIERLLKILKVNNVDNVILAYHPNSNSGTDNSNGLIPDSSDTSDSEATSLPHFNKSEENLHDLKSLWEVLEQYALDKKICRIGISDLDTEALTELFTTSKVRPSIAQISLASCCVVPQSLQEFCNKNEIQLLTHSDAEILLNDEAFAIPGYMFDWAVRYQVHVKCRGVLAAKGYIVGASKHT